MADRNYEQDFKDKLGDLYDPTVMDDFNRNTSNNGGGNADDWFNRISAKNELRSNNSPNSEYHDNGQGGYLTAAQAAPQYSGGGSSSGGGGGWGDFLAAQTARQGAQDARQQGLRDILMKQMGDLSGPLDENSPGIHDVLAGERIQSARGAQRQRGMLAEQMAANGLATSGAANTGAAGIEQQRAEKDAGFTGQTLNAELNNRRQTLQSYLTQALSLGDAEAARTLQAQMHSLDAQQQESQFGRSLGQGDMFHNDSMGYNYAALMSGLNHNAYSSALGMF